MKPKTISKSIFFAGIDLAWSYKNSTGIAVLELDKTGKMCTLVHYGLASTDEDIISILKKSVGNNDAFIAIDAPLIVPNETGRRPAEDIVSKLFRKYHAAPYPSNRKNMTKWSEEIRGEALSKKLEDNNFIHSPYLLNNSHPRIFFEVYPHPSTISMFNIDRIIEYKSKPNRSIDHKIKEFGKYLVHIKSFADKNKISLPKELFKKNISKLNLRELKDYEDTLDAVFCSFIAYYSWKNPKECLVLGDMKTGYILTPAKESIRKEYAEEQSRLDNY